MPLPDHVHVAVVGAGFAGLGAAIRLRQAGFDDLVVLERAGDVGGTWRENAYPGCACDVPSHLYSFSFAPNPGWSRTFSPREEIRAYLRDCAQRFGVVPHVRFGHELLAAAWEADRRRWRLQTSRGTLTADILVAAAGAFSEPSVPALPGLESFAGPVVHTARWDREVALAGRSVGVIGTGASSAQVVPRLAPEVAALRVFQRTAPWVLPRHERELRGWEHALYGRLPLAQRLARLGIYGAHELFVLGFLHPRLSAVTARLARRHLERTVPDPALRAKLTQDYTIGCKRILISDEFLPALTRPNVEVVTAAIRAVRPWGLQTADGAEHRLDALVLATGFHVTDPPVAQRVRGRDGRTLAEVWGGSPQAHVGTTVTGFPNLFVLLGPNTGVGHSSVVFMIESQIAHLLAALRALRSRSAAVIEPRPEAQAAYVAELDARMRGTVWTAGGCRSWYLDATGRNAALWPGSTWAFRRRVARLRPSEYRLELAR